MKKCLVSSIVVAMILAGIYATTPLFAMVKLRSNFEAGDIKAVTSEIDWPSLRAGFRKDSEEIIAKQIGARPALNLFGGILGDAVVSRMTSQVVDGSVTEDNLATTMRLMTRNGSTVPAEDAGLRGIHPGILRDLNFKMLEFESLVSVRAKFQSHIVGGDGNISARFELKGLSWKLTRIWMPLDEAARSLHVLVN